MNKLIIQIPCYNEEDALPVTLRAIPRAVAGVDEVEVLVVSDGSTDRTIEVARSMGVRHVLDLGTNRGLAGAFSAGVRECLRLGADYMVNLDADNQYNADDIPVLVEPLLAGRADFVVGERPIDSIRHFSRVKRLFQHLGSWFVRVLSNTPVRDTPSGFRALNRKAMARLFLFTRYTYTHESLIAAADAQLRVLGVPIRVNAGMMRKSRLMKSTVGYIVRIGGTMTRLYMLYRPYAVFLSIAALTGAAGLGLIVRFVCFYLAGDGKGHIQSLVIASILITFGLLCFMMAILSDIIRINRKLLQQVLAESRERSAAPADRGKES